ncbi:hypothetical protein BGW39_001553 [Mortierella sp. 14UC]|nr:hypothetical protein BGW39_001553 [Mortierella sp. 14UC]
MGAPHTIDVILADDPSKHLKGPFTADEPVYNIIQRIAIELQQPQADYNYQELYLSGFHLEYYPQLPLANYRILGGILTYQSFRKGEISVFVKTLTHGKTLCISCNPWNTVLALKKILFRREGVPLGQMLLQYHGKLLKDDSSLQSQGVHAMATLTMSTRVRGGLNLILSASTRFADVSTGNTENFKLVSRSSPGLTVRPGTNVQVMCPCTPRYQVICPVHFGTIELTQRQFICPNCKSSHDTVPVTVGFRMCKYRFHGLKADGTQFTTGWAVIDQQGYYRRFESRIQTEWTRLDFLAHGAEHFGRLILKASE